MFGYITVCKNNLSEEDFNTFSAYYCGVCKSIGHETSQIARAGLSYDITFLAIMLSSVTSSENIIKDEGCIIHPFKKRGTVKNDEAVDYAANMGVLLSYLKLLDNWNDERSIKAIMGMGAFYSAVKKAKEKYFNAYSYIKSQLDKLSCLEKEKCKSIDETADCFAKILEYLFSPSFIKDEATRRILSYIGYNIGRWIYIIDAFNDMKDDYKSKSYNPLLSDFSGVDLDEYRESIKDKTLESLTITLANTAASYDLLNVYKNKSLIENILFISLKNKQTFILNGGKNESIRGIGRQ